jgi:CRP-like cAMP-binding protein
MLGEFVYVLVWIYLGSILFFFWAEVLYVSEKIDIFVLEKIFLQGESLNKFERLIENFIFNRSARVFRRYGQHLTAGTAIIPDENPDYVYFLYSGCIGFYVENQMTQTRFGELKGGEIFGEMAHLLRENHNISIIAESDCMLFMLTHAVFDEMMSRSTSFSARIPTRRISIVRRKTAKLRESLHKLSRNPAHCANDEE